MANIDLATLLLATHMATSQLYTGQHCCRQLATLLLATVVSNDVVWSLYTASPGELMIRGQYEFRYLNCLAVKSKILLKIMLMHTHNHFVFDLRPLVAVAIQIFMSDQAESYHVKLHP